MGVGVLLISFAEGGSLVKAGGTLELLAVLLAVGRYDGFGGGVVDVELFSSLLDGAVLVDNEVKKVLFDLAGDFGVLFEAAFIGSLADHGGK